MELFCNVSRKSQSSLAYQMCGACMILAQNIVHIMWWIDIQTNQLYLVNIVAKILRRAIFFQQNLINSEYVISRTLLM